MTLRFHCEKTYIFLGNHCSTRNTEGPLYKTTHVVFLMPIVLHQGNDTIVDEKCQRKNTSQLREQRPELLEIINKK